MGWYYEPLMKRRLTPLVALLVLVGCTGGLAQRCSNPNELNRLGELRLKDPQAAVPGLEQYVAAHPRNDLAWTILGHAYEDLDEDAKARKAYDRALEVNPRAHRALTGLGILARKQGDYDGAMAYYQRAIAIDAKYAQAYSSMTTLALKRGKDAEALAYAKKGYALDKEDAVVAANLAIAYHYNGLVQQRDEMTAVARRLGYPDPDRLKQIYSGELTVRD